MKKILMMILPALLLVMASGCRRVSDNGEIDGNWQVMSVEELNAAGEAQAVLHPDRCYIAIQLEMVQFRNLGTDYKGGQWSAELNYDKHTRMLSVDIRKPEYKEGELRVFGVTGNPCTWKADANSRHLVLRNDKVVVTCRRW